MFGLFRRRNKRQIFRYWNGKRTVGIDPMVALRALNSHETFKWDLLKDLEAPDHKIADEAADVSLSATREVFGLSPYSEDEHGKPCGVTEAESMYVLLSFAVFLDYLKKNTNGTQTWQDDTAQSPLGSDDSVTSVKSDSGSTSTGRTCEASGQ